MIHPTGRRESEEEGVRERGRYRIKGPAALPDAVCVEHMEAAAEDSRVCNEQAGTSEGKHSNVQEHSGLPTQ